MAIRLLMVILIIIDAHAGRNPRISGGKKKTQRYPPTITPTGRAPTMHASKRRLLSMKIMLVAIRLARGPKITSKGPSQ